MLLKEGYTVISTKIDFDSQLYPSQVKVNVICSNGHNHFVTWNNFVNKKRRCRFCYEENKYNKSLHNKSNFKLYKYIVKRYTEINYKKHKQVINSDNYCRNRERHLDHKFSIMEGFKQNILPFIIGNQVNLEILDGKTNIQKYDKCSITKKELFNEYFRKN